MKSSANPGSKRSRGKPMTITYLTGDATQPVKKPALIMHVCNDVGAWGRGFVMALSRRWNRPEAGYRGLPTHDLGFVQFVQVGEDVWVANMIAQHDVWPDGGGTPPIRYDALAKCLTRLRLWRQDSKPSIHAPRIGCGLAGGSWSVVEPLIDFYLRDREVYIYDLPGAKE